MATFTKINLSGSTQGKPIIVVAIASPGTAIHTAIAGTAAEDEIYLWVSNLHTAPVALTLEWGGVTDPDHLLCKAVSIPANSGPIPIAVGQILHNALLVKAFADVASKLSITGYVHRIQ